MSASLEDLESKFRLEAPRNQRRRRLLVCPGFQLTLMAVSALVIAGICAAAGTFFEWHLGRMRELGQAAGLGESYFSQLAHQGRLVHIGLPVVAAVLIACSLYFVLKFTHKLAGPMVGVRSYLQRVCDSGLVPHWALKFRKGDFFGDLPYVLNEALYRLAHKGKVENGRDTDEVRKATSTKDKYREAA